MKKLLYLTILSTLSWLPLVASEKGQHEVPVAIDFEQLDDEVVGIILSHLPTADLLKMRSTEKRMLPLVEMELADRVEMLSGNDLFKVKHFAKSEFLIKKINDEIAKRTKEQHEQFWRKLLENNGTILNLSSYGIDYLYPGAFNGMVNLQELYLSYNQLTNIDKDVFKELKNLERLDLDHSQLTNLDKDVFKGLKNLKELYLCGNKLSNIDKDIFEELKNLKTLNISGNQLTNIDKDVFEELKNLKVLYLSYNKLTNIDKDVFKELKNLKVLNLSDNKLSGDNIEQLEKTLPGVIMV